MRPARALFLAAAIAFSPSAFAGPKIYGNSRYQFSNNHTMVTFGCGGINNPDQENATGTLQVRLWATAAPYTGGTLSGRVLGEFKLEGLNPRNYYSPVSRTVKADLPASRKRYYLVLTVSEFTSGGYVISDYRNFEGDVLLGPVDLFSLSGPWRFDTNREAGTVGVQVAKVAHTRSGRTGSLRLSVWATETPYRGGTIEGYKICSVDRAALPPGYSYNGIKNTAKFLPPPPGTYHVTLVLSEYQGDGYRIVDYLNGSSPVTF